MKRLCLVSLLLACTGFAQEERFIAVLKSEAPLKEKADACRELVRGGTRQAVPALAPLLADEKLSHLARYALEPIADPSVDIALRDALCKTKGPLLVGVISSLGRRKDPVAVEPMARLLADPDPAVVQAAARALGCIGGVAVPALERAVTKSAGASQLAVCDGLLRCAEATSGAGATAIYDKLRALPNLPRQLRVAAMRGAILSRGTAGLPLLAEAIRTEAYVPASDAIRISMEMPSAEVTYLLSGELASASVENQILLVQTLGCRGDSAVARVLMPLAQSGPVNRRIAALHSLIQLAEPSSLPAVVALVADPEADISRAALAGLVGFPGAPSDAALMALLDGTQSKLRVAVINAVGQRRISAAVPALSKLTSDADPEVAAASLKALHSCSDVGFTSIFNGKDLSGWDGKPGWWSVEDGALTVESTPAKPCKECNYLIWRGGQPADFELMAEFKLSRGANSGVQLRSEERPNWDTSGYQADMTGDGSLVSFVYHHKRGLIAGRGEKAVFAADGKKSVESLGAPAELLKHFKQGEWNTYHIICRGPEITLSVNGRVMCQITDHHATQAAARGIIALQMHPGPPMKIQFKNIRIKNLSTAAGTAHAAVR